MKNSSRLSLTLAPFLGVSVQGFGQTPNYCSYQVGNIFLQSTGGSWNSLWIIFILFLLFIGIILEKAASAKLKNSTQQYELIKPIQDEWIKPIREDRIPSVSDWLGRFLTIIIPVVGLIALIVWAVDDKDKIRKNWAIAFLVFAILLTVFFYFLGGLFVERFMDRMRRY